MHRGAVAGGAQRRRRKGTAHWLDDDPRWPAHSWQPRIVIRATPCWVGSRLWNLDYLHGTSGGRLCGGHAASGSGAGAFGSVVEHAADASSHAV